MKTVSPLKPTSLFLVLNLAPKGGEQGPQTAGLRPQTPGEAAPPPASGGRLCLPWAAPPTLLHTKRKKEFLFLVVVVGGCGYVGEVG